LENWFFLHLTEHSIAYFQTDKKCQEGKQRANHQVKWKHWIIYIRCTALCSSFLAISVSSHFGKIFCSCFCLLISLIALPVRGALLGRASFFRLFRPFCLPMRYLLFTHKDKGHGSRRTWKLPQIFIYEASFVRLPAVIWPNPPSWAHHEVFITRQLN